GPLVVVVLAVIGIDGAGERRDVIQARVALHDPGLDQGLRVVVVDVVVDVNVENLVGSVQLVRHIEGQPLELDGEGEAAPAGRPVQVDVPLVHLLDDRADHVVVQELRPADRAGVEGAAVVPAGQVVGGGGAAGAGGYAVGIE